MATRSGQSPRDTFTLGEIEWANPVHSVAAVTTVVGRGKLLCAHKAQLAKYVVGPPAADAS